MSIQESGIKINKETSVRKSVCLGLLIALTIILRRYLNFHVRLITFGGFPIILAGVMFGPYAGACVGALSDILGYFINSFGQPYHPGFTLTAALNGFIPPLILLMAQRKNKIPNFWFLTLAIFVTQFITGVILGPYFYSQMLGKSFMYMKVLEGLVTQLFHAPLYAFLIHRILRAYYL